MTATIYEIVDVQVLDSQQVLNVFHFVDPAGSVDVAGLLDNYIDDVLPAMQGLQSTAVSHIALKYRQVYPAATLQLERAIFPSLDGSEGGDVLPSAVAMSGKWILGDGTVNLGGGTPPHIKRGGVRVAGATEANIIGNNVVAGYATGWLTWVEALLVPGEGAFQLCVASFLNAARARQHTVQQYAIVTGGSSPSPSTQNTRKVLRGRTF